MRSKQADKQTNVKLLFDSGEFRRRSVDSHGEFTKAILLIEWGLWSSIVGPQRPAFTAKKGDLVKNNNRNTTQIV